jgi:uncharacterized FlaG/YvyC family protein
MVDISAVNTGPVQLQPSSVAVSQTKETAQVLHGKAAATADPVKALDHVIDALGTGNSLEMHYDKDINRVIVQVVDGKTQKVVFQIPREGMVNLMKSFRNYLKAIKEGV